MSLAGKTVVFTGTLSMKRADATKMAVAAGAKVTGSVSKSTNIIVAGADASSTSKVITAKAFGTTIWTEADFKKGCVKGPSDKPVAKSKAALKGRSSASRGGGASLKPPSEKEQHAFSDLAKSRDFDKVIAMVTTNKAYVNVQPAGRWSALHQAAEAGHEKTVKFLLANGANLEAKTKDGKTPRDVAKDNVKALLVPPSKRKASESSGPAKRVATGGTKVPTLHLFEPKSAIDLSEEKGDWLSKEDEQLCEEGVIHKAVKDAPNVAKKLAERLNTILTDVTLLGGESDTDATIIVISNPGDDAQEACLKALAIKEELENGDDCNPWEMATFEAKDFSSMKKFIGDDEDEDSEEDGDEDAENIRKATTIMAKELTGHFELNFEEDIVTAPVIYGGYAKDKSIVGVLGMRVWT